MIESVLGILANFIIALISTLGYWGIALAMAIESALIPLPSEIIMPFSGYLVSQGEFNFYAVIVVGAVGNVLGSLLAYALGYWGEDAFIRGLIKKYGKWLLLTVNEFDNSIRWFHRYGEIIVFVSRLLPVVRTFISLPAGMAKMNLTKFIFYTFAGSLIWSALLTKIGEVMGENWVNIEVVWRKFDLAIAIILILAIFYYVKIKIKHIRNEKA